jgi:hypothetical protein
MVMTAMDRCSAPGCLRPDVTALDLQPVCLSHFMAACYDRLELLSKNLQTDSAEDPIQESALRFVQECPRLAIDISQKDPELTIQDRARLVEIVFWATQMGRQLRRNTQAS